MRTRSLQLAAQVDPHPVAKDLVRFLDVHDHIGMIRQGLDHLLPDHIRTVNIVCIVLHRKDRDPLERVARIGGQRHVGDTSADHQDRHDKEKEPTEPRLHYIAS
jgi:hypothetical protein